MADELLVTTADVLSAWPKFGQLPETEQTALIAQASQKVLNFCRRPGFLQQSVTEVLDGRNSPVLWLSRRPILAVSTVTINDDDALDNTFGDAWSFNPTTGKLFRGNGRDDPRFGWWFPLGFQNVTVEYVGGYTAVPDPVVRATVFLVQYLAELNKVSFVYKSESIGDYSYDLNEAATTMGMPVVVANLLAEYVQDDISF